MKKTDCTLCVIKPHVIKAQQAGELLTHISSSGYCIEGLFSVHMTLQMAHELFEVYRGMVWLDGWSRAVVRHFTRLIVFA